ncbi:MAG: 6-phosphogluconolactonase [Proteobacteria bacterium]|nr:6-phosphogluconolactonase [Pseudomonadota bacterium]
MAEPQVFADPEALAQHAADWLLAWAAATAAKPNERFSVCLSGGSTPKRLYELLAADPRRRTFPWERTHWFWGDERFVPPDDKASNYRMTREAMLDHVPVPAANVHPIPTVGLTPQQAAEAYRRELREFHGEAVLDPARPLFNVVLLGLGTNGHTASLFPGQPVLDERRAWTGTMTDPEAGTRITLTYPALESAREVVYLVAGKDKQPMLKRLLAADATIPAGRLKPQGALHFFVDRAAFPD